MPLERAGAAIAAGAASASPEIGHTRFIRVKEVVRRTGLSVMTIWRYRKAGTFPSPIRLGPNATAFVEEEVESWCAAHIAERDHRANGKSPDAAGESSRR